MSSPTAESVYKLQDETLAATDRIERMAQESLAAGRSAALGLASNRSTLQTIDADTARAEAAADRAHRQLNRLNRWRGRFFSMDRASGWLSKSNKKQPQQPQQQEQERPPPPPAPTAARRHRQNPSPPAAPYRSRPLSPSRATQSPSSPSSYSSSPRSRREQAELFGGRGSAPAGSGGELGDNSGNDFQSRYRERDQRLDLALGRIGDNVDEMMQMALTLNQETREQSGIIDRIAPRMDETVDTTERARKRTARLLGRRAARESPR